MVIYLDDSHDGETKGECNEDHIDGLTLYSKIHDTQTTEEVEAECTKTLCCQSFAQVT